MEESMGFDALYNQLQLRSYYAHSPITNNILNQGSFINITKIKMI